MLSGLPVESISWVMCTNHLHTLLIFSRGLSDQRREKVKQIISCQLSTLLSLKFCFIEQCNIDVAD